VAVVPVGFVAQEHDGFRVVLACDPLCRGTISAVSDVGVIVTGVLVGSASGIGGALLGAWMNGRSQMASLMLSIAAEDKRARVADKRHVYAAFLTSVNELWTAVMRYPVDEDRDAMERYDDQTLLPAARQMDDRGNELGLIAPEAVVAMRYELRKIYSAAVQKRVSGTDVPSEFKPAIDDLVQRIAVMMREDLGSS
jgi:hypothetical protein